MSQTSRGRLTESSDKMQLPLRGIGRTLLPREGWNSPANPLSGEVMTKSHSIPVFFHQGCPVCGRLLNIGVTLLGKRVYCQHCGGKFIAADPSAGPTGAGGRDRRVEDLIERAEVALQQAAESPGLESAWQAHD